MEFSTKLLQKARETYWMDELWTIFPYGLNDRIGDEFKTDTKHINVAAKFSCLPRKYSCANYGKTTKVFPVFYHNNF